MIAPYRVLGVTSLCRQSLITLAQSYAVIRKATKQWRTRTRVKACVKDK